MVRRGGERNGELGPRASDHVEKQAVSGFGRLHIKRRDGLSPGRTSVLRRWFLFSFRALRIPRTEFRELTYKRIGLGYHLSRSNKKPLLSSAGRQFLSLFLLPSSSFPAPRFRLPPAAIMGFVDQAIEQVSGGSVAVFVAASATLYYVLVRLERRRRRRKLGPPAPRAPYRLPWGISFSPFVLGLS